MIQDEVSRLKNNSEYLCAIIESALEKNTAIPAGFVREFLELSRKNKTAHFFKNIKDDVPVGVAEFGISKSEVNDLRLLIRERSSRGTPSPGGGVVSFQPDKTGGFVGGGE